MTFAGNLSLPMLLLGAFKGKHTFKIASYTEKTMLIYNPARGENQPEAGAGIEPSG
jgi:hypothetical protein